MFRLFVTPSDSAPPLKSSVHSDVFSAASSAMEVLASLYIAKIKRSHYEAPKDQAFIAQDGGYVVEIQLDEDGYPFIVHHSANVNDLESKIQKFLDDVFHDRRA